jgi:hypothetical protein
MLQLLQRILLSSILDVWAFIHIHTAHLVMHLVQMAGSHTLASQTVPYRPSGKLGTSPPWFMHPPWGIKA